MRSSQASGRTSLTPDWQNFERIARAAHLYTDSDGDDGEPANAHPFETRNIHPELPPKVKKLFDDGYYAEATFEAFKFVEKEVKRAAGVSKGSGYSLMMSVFNENSPAVRLTPLQTESERDEQMGYKNIFAGAQSAIRNPRGHETDVVDTPDLCLDHLAVASVLLRKMDDAGVRT